LDCEFSRFRVFTPAEKILFGLVLGVIQSRRSSGGITMSHDPAVPGADAPIRRPPLLTLRALVLIAVSAAAGLLTAHAAGIASGVEAGLSTAAALHLLVSNDQ
jgi:hypothetical protein